MYRRDKISQWIADGEGASLDFKQHINSAPKIARSLVAFANSRGGKIVVGVEDHGHIVGIDVGEEQYELELAGRKFCDPPIHIEFEPYEYGGRMLLIAHVEESTQKPHIAIDKKGRRKIYVRIADECIVPNDTIRAVLESGDMNNLHRNAVYHQLRRELFQYLKKYGQISVQDYIRLKSTTERGAKRTLLDFLFEGLLYTKDGITFTLA
ncbi:MAG: helix-turn-helix domain-containing protein [Chitinophagales bacterium]